MSALYPPFLEFLGRFGPLPTRSSGASGDRGQWPLQLGPHLLQIAQAERLLNSAGYFFSASAAVAKPVGRGKPSDRRRKPSKPSSCSWSDWT